MRSKLSGAKKVRGAEGDMEREMRCTLDSGGDGSVTHSLEKR